MPKEIHQTSHIRIEERNGAEHVVPAPKNFSWIPYPRTVEIDGRTYQYRGCLDAYPFYKEIEQP